MRLNGEERARNGHAFFIAVVLVTVDKGATNTGRLDTAAGGMQHFCAHSCIIGAHQRDHP